MIPFFSISSVAEEIYLNKITDKKSMYYLLSSIIIGVIQTQYSILLGIPPINWLFYFESLCSIVIICIGLIYCWQINKGENFIFRFICLSVPISIRVFILNLAFGIILFFKGSEIFNYEFFKNPELAYNIFIYILFFYFNIYFWYLMYKGMSIISKRYS